MALNTYHHGVRTLEVNEGSQTIKVVSTAVIGLIATAPDADDAVFPLNRPVLFTRINKAIDAAGTTGTLLGALKAIQLQVQPVIIVVRVPEGEGADEAERQADQISKVIGSIENGEYLGAQALRIAESRLGVKPRIIGAPGLDTQEVTTELVGIAQEMRAMVYASCWGCTDASEAMAYRENFGARELMLLWPNVMQWDTTTSAAVEAPAVAFALGLRARIDKEQGWHKTLSNVPMNGAIGISKDVHFDLQNENSEATLLNAAGITTIINREGFRFWGSRTCSTDDYFIFESATRTAQIMADTMAEGHFWAVDKPLHPSLVKDIVEGINAHLRRLKTSGYILGGTCWYDAESNTSDTLKVGTLRIDYDYTPVPPLEDLGFIQRITDTYFADFATRVGTGT